jgi:26S proteasome regulatory subunit N2
MEGAIDTGFPLLYRNQVLRFLLPLFPQPLAAGEGAAYANSIIHLLVTQRPLDKPFSHRKRGVTGISICFRSVEGGSQDIAHRATASELNKLSTLYIKLNLTC